MGLHQYGSFFTFAQFAKRHQQFTVPGLRWIRHRSRERVVKGELLPANGFAGAFLSIGGRVHIDEDRFFVILYERNGITPNSPVDAAGVCK